MGQSAGEVWSNEAQIVPADDDSISSVSAEVSTQSFIDKAGAHNVFKTERDRATVQYWREQIRTGSKVEAMLHLDAAGNVIGADGRHRAVAASLEGRTRIHVNVRRNLR